MIRYFLITLVLIFAGIDTPGLIAQYKLPFGDIQLEELSNKPYKPDPGADAVILSDIGVATLNYVNGFYVELERDVRIRIVNGNGYDYANIEVPYTINDRIYNQRASTFNLSNGEKVETKIGKKGFITENSGGTDKILKFSFPDVHEGSVIEYSYIIQLRGDAVYSLIPWAFQSDIPVEKSSFTISYPEPCTYKQIISGSAKYVRSGSKTAKDNFLGERINVITTSWLAENVPAFREEPYIKSKKEHLTRLTFELANINFPGNGFNEITPTYSNLTTKLLERSDFGRVINTDLKSFTEKIVKGETDNPGKLKKIHEYITTNILWNGVNDFTASGPLHTILKNKKGNSADINMLLIAMLRSVSIKADPVILSTRSNGTINRYSAMMQQFNYLLAYVWVNGDYYLVDATDPLRPYNILPFSCLNDIGWLVSEYESKFIDLKNNEKQSKKRNLELKLDPDGNLTGTMETEYSDYSALNVRKVIKLESKEGYIDMIKSLAGDINMSDFKISRENDIYSDLAEKCNVNISSESQLAGDEILLNPYLSVLSEVDPFKSPERKFPIDFGCPLTDEFSLKLMLPENYSVVDKPENISFAEGKDNFGFDFKCTVNGRELVINSVFKINKILFAASEYSEIRSFYSRMLKKQAELIVIKKNPAL